jgi:hypothetical protein
MHSLHAYGSDRGLDGLMLRIKPPLVHAGGLMKALQVHILQLNSAVVRIVRIAPARQLRRVRSFAPGRRQCPAGAMQQLIRASEK